MSAAPEKRPGRPRRGASRAEARAGVLFATPWMIGLTLFTLLPLLPIRRVSPLVAIRSSFAESADRPDPLRWVVYAAIVVAVELSVILVSEPLGRRWRGWPPCSRPAFPASSC